MNAMQYDARLMTRGANGMGTWVHSMLSLGVGLTFGAAFSLRYLGLWAENDTQVFVRLAGDLLSFARLDHPGSYPHGFGYPVWLVQISAISGIEPGHLSQLYLPVVGCGILSVIAFSAFRRLVGHDSIATLGVVTVFLVPEVVFTVARGNHEKLTIALTLVAILSLANGFIAYFRHKPWRVFFGWVAAYYLTAFSLSSTHAMFGSSFIAATTLAFLLAAVVGFLRRDRVHEVRLAAGRLLLVSVASWSITGLILFFVFPQAGENLRLLSTTAERLSSLLLTFTPESDPYSVTGTDWRSPTVYAAISSFRWVLFGVSFITWLLLLRRMLSRSGAVSSDRLLLLAMYGAFGLQLAIAIPVDFLGLEAGSNLQVRIFTYFALFAAPVFALGLDEIMKRALRSRWRPAVVPGMAMLATAFAVLSVLKSTLDPAVSNRWLFYSPDETQAVALWDQMHQERVLWTGVDPRLAHAHAIVAGAQTYGGNRLLAAHSDASHVNAVSSLIITSAAVAWMRPVPEYLEENLVYDNGFSTISHRIPRTAFQR